ncbi:helitron_like_N domain-containing protein [Trichonephila clavipes]|nr:helitron_like_N domain-containing protein [Trichonephila clavipes]
MNKECRICGALKWKEESAGMCCSGGKVALPSIDEPVEPLKKLFSYETDESRRFLKNIRKYNTCFQKTSFGADNIVSMQVFCPTFTIQGQIYHTIGSLLPATNIQPKFWQVYFMGDKEAQVNRRSEYVQGVERNTVQKIQQVLHNHNILVHEFKMAKDRVTSDNYKVVMLSQENMLKNS